MQKLSLLLLVGILLGVNSFLFAAGGKIIGTVRDSTTNSPLPGANVFFAGLNIGTTTDIHGEFILTNAPLGRHELTIDYIGFERKRIPVQVRYRTTLKLDIKLKPKVVKGETVVITAQAEGQIQAINQQLASKTIKNIVSKKQIQELPEANAAEAVGRLPGVSLERSGGEGNKVVIRGMAPKYALIQIDGVDMAATGAGDRSTDLSMISPYMLEGIELTKSVMANQEATATGGIVNFRIKRAPAKPTFDVIAQGGHNSLKNTYRNYKVSIGGSNRFYADLLGVYAQVDVEGKDASSNQLGGVWFYQENVKSPVETRTVNLTDINRRLQRLGATMVLDFSLPSTLIKFSNFFSRISRNQQQHSIYYGYYYNDFGRGLVDEPKSQLTVMTNVLKLEHYWNNLKIYGSVSHSYSGNETPERLDLSVNFAGDVDPYGPLKSTFYKSLDPYSIPDSLKYSDDQLVRMMNLGNFSHTQTKTKESDFAYDLNASYDINFSKFLKLRLSIGGKYKHKNKDFDQDEHFTNISEGGPDYMAFRDMIIDHYWDQLSAHNRDLKGRSASTGMNYADFVDRDYPGGNFLGGRYNFGLVPDLDMFRTIDDMAIERHLYLPDNFNSILNDYHGHEDYWAAYIMPEINIGSKLVFIPGVRYESNRTEYTGYRGDTRGIVAPWKAFHPDTTTYVRKNEFVLPMIQTFYKPLDWLNIKLGYTHTLQRPNYWDIIPSYRIDRSFVGWRNFRLRPEQAENWDIQFSVFSNKVGLLSLGGFHKKITDMIFYTGNRAIIHPEKFELPKNVRFALTSYATNNEFDAINYGYEFEWKSNFWYLPGVLRGLVCNVNYTRNWSKAKYLRTRIKTEYDQFFRPTLINMDTTYTNPMILQPKHLFNLTLGFDYKGFSVRWAMRYKSHIFKAANWYKDLRGYSTDFYRYDLAIRQKLPVSGLELFLNVNNLTNEIERDIINYMDFTRYEEHYGRNANAGLRYQF